MKKIILKVGGMSCSACSNHVEKYLKKQDGIIDVSVNSGTDIAANSASVILMNDNLEKIITLLKISKKTVRNIKQNLFWAFFYNTLMIPLAIGFFKPLGLIISSLTVVLNALRLNKYKY